MRVYRCIIYSIFIVSFLLLFIIDKVFVGVFDIYFVVVAMDVPSLSFSLLLTPAFPSSSAIVIVAVAIAIKTTMYRRQKNYHYSKMINARMWNWFWLPLVLMLLLLL